MDGDALGDAWQAHRLLGIEAVAFRQVQQVDQPVAHGQVLAGLGDQVDERVAAAPVGDVADAAGHHDLQVWPGGLHLPERMQLSVDAVLRLLAHDARVQHHHVRLVRPLGGGQPVFLQALRQPPRVGHVHLAANGPDMKAAHQKFEIIRVRVLQ